MLKWFVNDEVAAIQVQRNKVLKQGFKGARYLLIIHEVLVAMDFFSAGV